MTLVERHARVVWAYFLMMPDGAGLALCNPAINAVWPQVAGGCDGGGRARFVVASEKGGKGPVSVLRHRNFAVVFAGQLISQAGNNLFNIALPWYVYTRTGSKAALTLAGLAVTLPTLAGLFTGV
ncbi:MAG: hypothetical protein K6U89_14685, partial [Chloroflexi bacterium]|nr:hypothetical protein [Chloroflexota bacterium]